ncbi:hypothetical protein ACWHA6_36320 [Streptomyces anthocyanicus]
MAWGKVDDRLHSHIKWRRSSKGARALWTTALSWCSEHPSDGVIPTDMLGYLDGTRSEAQTLVNVGLWDQVEGGWRFHEWEERNPDGDSARAAVDAKRSGAKRGNHERWHVKRGLTVDDCEWCSASPSDRSKR